MYLIYLRTSKTPVFPQWSKTSYLNISTFAFYTDAQWNGTLLWSLWYLLFCFLKVIQVLFGHRDYTIFKIRSNIPHWSDQFSNVEWLGFFEIISSQLLFFPWVLLFWTPRWLRSGVAAPRPRRIRRSECLQRQEAAAEARQRRRRVLRVLEWRGWCGWRRSCCCCWDFFFWRYTSRCCGAARCSTEMTLWARSRWRRWVLWKHFQIIFFSPKSNRI